EASGGVPGGVAGGAGRRESPPPAAEPRRTRRHRGRRGPARDRSGARALMRFTRRLGDAARRWARRRQGLDRNPIVLNRRRVYILPTRQGAAFGALLFAMLLGSMNYSSSPGFLLTFSLAALAFVAMNHTHR